MRGRRFFIILALVFLTLLLMAPSAQALQTRNLAVSRVADTSAILVVKTDTGSDVTVDYGFAPGATAATVTSSGQVRHELPLAGLPPSAPVYYRVTISESGNPGNTINVAEKSFITTRAAGQSFSYAVVGDNRPGSDTTIQPAVWSTIVGQMAAGGLDLSLHVGDIIYGVGSDTLSQNVSRYDGLFDVTSALTASVPMYVAAGNHERLNYSNSRAGFEQEFTMPLNNGVDRDLYGEEYYSFDHGDTHFVMLCTEIPGQEGMITGNQLAWLQQDLAATTKTWITVGLHRPLFSGVHAADPWVNTANTAGQQNKAALHALFLSAGVDLVFAGHDHYYLRHVEDGIQYIITGGAGSPLSTPWLRSGDVFGSGSYEHVRVDESSGSLTVTAVSSAGAVLESFSLAAPASGDILSLQSAGVYWVSYADYAGGYLSVDFLVGNESAANVTDVRIVWLTATAGAAPAAFAPLSLGDLAPDGSAGFSGRYLVPAGVLRFNTAVYATAYDSLGQLHQLPGPAPS